MNLRTRVRRLETVRPIRRVLPDDLRMMYAAAGITLPKGPATLDEVLGCLPDGYRQQVLAALREEIADP